MGHTLMKETGRGVEKQDWNIVIRRIARALLKISLLFSTSSELLAR
jgi:hypothetical protein